MENTYIINILLVVGAYLLGSISNAVWIGKCFYGIDPRTQGSKNAGATNAVRVLGAKAGGAVFALDALKGVAAVMLAHLSHYVPATPSYYNLQMVLALTAVLGHMWPIFAGFKGGKGVATFAGALCAITPLPIAILLGVFVVVFVVTRYVSVGSLTVAVLLPIVTRFVCGVEYLPITLFYCLVTLIIVYTHRKNIGRLIAGTENRFTFKKS